MELDHSWDFCSHDGISGRCFGIKEERHCAFLFLKAGFNASYREISIIVSFTKQRSINVELFLFPR